MDLIETAQDIVRDVRASNSKYKDGLLIGYTEEYFLDDIVYHIENLDLFRTYQDLDDYFYIVQQCEDSEFAYSHLKNHKIDVFNSLLNLFYELALYCFLWEVFKILESEGFRMDWEFGEVF